MTSSAVDCVVVGGGGGAEEPSMDRLFRSALPLERVSGHASYLRQNSVISAGRRLTYMDYLGELVAKIEGSDPGYNLARMPNLAACHLKSFLLKSGYTVEIVNSATLDAARFRELLAGSPMTVAVSTTFYFNPSSVARIVRAVRALSPETRIVAGGAYIHSICMTQEPAGQDSLFAMMDADIYVDDFAGELALARIVAELRGSSPNLDGIPNLIYRPDGGRFRRTAREPENHDPDAALVEYERLGAQFLGDTVQMRTAHSCAFKCAFCLHHVRGGKLRAAGVPAVEASLAGLRRLGVRRIAFVDDTFNIPLARFKDLCRMMIRNRFDFEWYSFFRGDKADDEALALMKESGCRGVFLGIESADDSVLANMNKGATADEMRRGCMRLREFGIATLQSFVFGFPGETDETARRTIDFIRETQPTFYHCELWFCDPSTPIMTRSAEFGLRGKGYGWSHRTMDWRQASAWVRRAYETITESSILPVHGFDFWSLPYLRSKGLSIEDVVAYAEMMRGPLLRGLDDREISREEHDEILARFGRRRGICASQG